jgi:hypothetical protein
MAFPYGEPATRLRGTPLVDRFSGEATSIDWTAPNTAPLTGAFDPGSSTVQFEVGRDPVVTQPSFITDFGADVRAGDRLTIRGRTWDVDGDPAEYRSPFSGWEAGMVVKLKAVRG